MKELQKELQYSEMSNEGQKRNEVRGDKCMVIIEKKRKNRGVKKKWKEKRKRKKKIKRGDIREKGKIIKKRSEER